MRKEDKSAWKASYFVKMNELLNDYQKCFVVSADNVTSKQMQQIRISLRGKAVVLMGKNTMMRKAIRGMMGENPDLEQLLPHVKGNVGLVFTNEELTEIRELIESNKVEAPARAGAISPVEVIVPPQNTGLGPEKTSFFQALSIPTKIARGTIEITSAIPILKIGDKVGMSESTLLTMLKIYPFSYGLIITQVYDNGSCFSPAILDVTDDDMRSKFLDGVRNIASVCLQIGYPTVASVPHSIVNGFKNLLAVAAETEISFKEAETMKAYLADPSAFASAAPAAAAKEEVKEEAKAESESSSDSDMGMDMFGD